ncbi:hypothetical protein FQN50_005553 [Emmonsiellopsis sp. PD_5]|nr:hypothetical protein FQN50_005553 [Emmonsiellopsis sp. PD_5]
MAPPRPVADEHIEADSELADGDSTYEGSLGDASYTTSITSSIKHYKYENGRRYHAFKEGEYFLPNDEEEQDRMDLSHHIYRTLLGGKTYTAPVPEDVQRVLDLGTGTGIWAIDFADEHPSAEVIGNDLSPIQPSWTPPNCKFEVDDFEATWSYSKPFDYIHGREMEGMVRDLDKLFKQAYDNLAPGGFFEMQSIIGEFYGDEGTGKGQSLRKWVDLVVEATGKFGKPMRQVHTWAEKMEKAGFKNITSQQLIVRSLVSFIPQICQAMLPVGLNNYMSNMEIAKYQLPFGPWPKDRKLKELGRYHQLQLFQALGAYSLGPLTRAMGWSPAEIEVLLSGVRKDLKDTSLHCYTKVHFVYGQKVVMD